ncbi:MAG: ferredoxin [Nanoarchaeota archaeon]|nr:ferredoxin [Nanoarchaeota archaeon]
MKIKIDIPSCIGCGACTTVADERIELENVNGEMKAVVKKNDFTDDEVTEMIEVCPTDAISKG